MYFHFTFMLVLDSWFLEKEETEPYKPSNLCLATRLKQPHGRCLHLSLSTCPTMPDTHTSEWAQALQIYPLKSLAQFFFSGITFSFRIDTTTLEYLSEVHTRT